MKLFVLLLVGFMDSVGQADDVKLETTPWKFNHVLVSAENVKGVNLSFSAELTIDDCNHLYFGSELKKYAGSGDSYYDSYLAVISISKTEMFCPLEKPYKKTMESKKQFIPAATGKYTAGKVVLSVLVPDGYQLKAEAVK